MEGLTRLLSPDSLKGRGIRLVEGHFSYFVFKAEGEQKVRDLFKPGPVELRTLERWSDPTKAAK